MKSVENNAAAIAKTGVSRRAWTAPETRRLSTSTAEANPAGSFDASEQFS